MGDIGGGLMRLSSSPSKPCPLGQSNGVVAPKRVVGSKRDDELNSGQYDEYVANAPRLFTCEWAQCGTVLGSWHLFQKHLNKLHCRIPAVTGNVGSSSRNPTSFPCRYGSCAHRKFASGPALLEHLHNDHIDSLKLACPMKGCLRPHQSLAQLRHHLTAYHGLAPASPELNDRKLGPFTSFIQPLPTSRPVTVNNPKAVPTYLVALPKVSARPLLASIPPPSKLKIRRPPLVLNGWFGELYDDDAPHSQQSRVDLTPTAPQLDGDFRALRTTEAQSLASFLKIRFGTNDGQPVPSVKETSGGVSAGKGKEKLQDQLTVKTLPRAKGNHPFVFNRPKIVADTQKVHWLNLSATLPSPKPEVHSMQTSPQPSTPLADCHLNTSPAVPRLPLPLALKRQRLFLSSDSEDDDPIDSFRIPATRSPRPGPTARLTTIPPRPVTIGFAAFNTWFEAHVAAGGDTAGGQKRIVSSPKKRRRGGRASKRQKKL